MAEEEEGAGVLWMDEGVAIRQADGVNGRRMPGVAGMGVGGGGAAMEEAEESETTEIEERAGNSCGRGCADGVGMMSIWGTIGSMMENVV